jgi:hypothetical protein
LILGLGDGDGVVTGISVLTGDAEGEISCPGDEQLVDRINHRKTMMVEPAVFFIFPSSLGQQGRTADSYIIPTALRLDSFRVCASLLQAHSHLFPPWLWLNVLL